MFVAIVYRAPETMEYHPLAEPSKPRILRVYGITAETMVEAKEIAQRISYDANEEWVEVIMHHEGIQLELLESVG